MSVNPPNFPKQEINALCSLTLYLQPKVPMSSYSMYMSDVSRIHVRTYDLISHS